MRLHLHYVRKTYEFMSLGPTWVDGDQKTLQSDDSLFLSHKQKDQFHSDAVIIG